ncbi:type I-F CRISPR-associated helicase Cas3f [Rheinheimera sp. WS51]|uniref:type I-F CRISPR-associated helicase Cas3f n=1 Tax=Rheinheimera sp. WS51 TaxID=3425886 RepID=UPI003D907CBD
MMVTFVSQCEKNALKKTRRVLDAFANRIGDNTWQTLITEDGLLTVKKMLRQTASRSTAVSCHWIRSRSRSQLLWVVGRRSAFNHEGIVPVNSTKKNLLHNEWESNWIYAPSIQIMATLAALMHDLGKSTLGFQSKLFESAKQADPYRHEWLSLKLFIWLVKDCQTDRECLERFINIKQYLLQNTFQSTVLQGTEKDNADLENLPPLMQWLAWLIVSHHRLPPLDKAFYDVKAKEQIKTGDKKLKRSQGSFYKKLKASDYWVRNQEAAEKCERTRNNSFWKMDNPVIKSPDWQSGIKRWATKALANTALMQLSDMQQVIANPLLLHLSRLSLMLGDHNYSSLEKDDRRRIKITNKFTGLAANTDRKTGEVKQPLDEHLLGVAKFTAVFARQIPVIAEVLPRIQQQQTLQKHTNIERFKWQNKGYDLALTQQKASDENGFFGVNMASTGCGKTIGNARIMYALSDPAKGARFTIALGLRILTLQTGQSFRQDLGLDNDQLAVLVGGAHKALFELQSEQKEYDESEKFGSESVEELLYEWVDGDINLEVLNELGLGTVIENPSAKALLAAPIVSCTVDHIIQASECKRGGKYIAPMLRLLSSDLVLDEPDDFNHEDLPALARLVHLAGLFGAKVLLSSATLPPDLIAGLFKAYKAGRELYNQSQNKAAPQIVCAWFDENRCQATQTSAPPLFNEQHLAFTKKRAEYLNKQPTQRKAKILPITLSFSQEKKPKFYQELSDCLLKQAFEFHQQYHLAKDNKKVSIGLIRIANIDNIIGLAKAMYTKQDFESNTHIHLCCYHAKQLLLLRNNLEQKLDRVLKRKEEQPELLLSHPEVKAAIKASSAQNHIFIVMATPVAEVGRDHDYDWAIVEPSSMRSIIQLAGRVWRHRPNKVAEQPNIAIMQYNIRSMKLNHKIDQPVFIRPGFESKQHLLQSHDMQQLLPSELLEKINANPRALKPLKLEPEKRLVDLEQHVMQTIMNNDSLNYVNAYWYNENTSQRSHTFLQTISPFRAGQMQDAWLILPNDDGGFDFYNSEQVKKQTLFTAKTNNENFIVTELENTSTNISPWLSNDLSEALIELQNLQPEKSLTSLAIKFATVNLENNVQGWCFNETLGFWRK